MVLRDRSVLEARALTKVYKMGEVEVHALRGVDFSLEEGELMVLLGASGSGKSTLLNILGGLDVPTGGQVFYRDQELTESISDQLTLCRRDHVGFVFQLRQEVPTRPTADSGRERARGDEASEQGLMVRGPVAVNAVPGGWSWPKNARLAHGWIRSPYQPDLGVGSACSFPPTETPWTCASSKPPTPTSMPRT
jgi:ATPase subunit of ABC transporter with duplicated ATPase domains